MMNFVTFMFVMGIFFIMGCLAADIAELQCAAHIRGKTPMSRINPCR